MTLASGASWAAPQSDTNPVYVDDSPRAWELFQRAREQAETNPTEAARLAQELLDQYAPRLIPAREDVPDRLTTVRRRVLEFLLEQPTVLERYRLRETAEAERLAAAGDLERLVLTRPLTAPALPAALALAERDLETARFERALSRLEPLESHPDLDETEAVFRAHLAGLAAVYLGREDLAASSIATLRDLAARAPASAAEVCLEHVEHLAAGAPSGFPVAPAPVSSLTLAPPSDVAAAVAKPAWSIELDEAPIVWHFRPSVGTMTRDDPAYREAVADGRFTSVVPVVYGEAVYVNEGHRVRAIDRLSGEILWSRTFGEPAFSLASTPAPITDLNTVAVGEDTVVAVIGYVVEGERLGRGEIVALDLETGETRWSVTLAELFPDAETDGFFAYGRPVIDGGVVYLPARRTSREMLTSDHVLALDLHEGGALRWSRFVASSGGLARDEQRDLSNLALHDGAIDFATPVGAVARLDPATGFTRWLVRTNVPMFERYDPRRPWETALPVLTPRGLLVFAPEGDVLLLDPASGETIGRFPPSHFGNPRYFLADEERLYAIGPDVRAFAHENYDAPLWSLDRTVGGGTGVTPVGRVQLTASTLIVPGEEEFFVVDRETGVPATRLSFDAPGNPVAAGGELIVAFPDRLEGYLTLELAERVLRARLASNPTVPDPALLLMRIAMRAGSFDLAIEAADLARGAIDAKAEATPERAEARRELFLRLLELDRGGAAPDVARGDELLQRVREVARGPLQEAAAELAQADWLRRSAADAPGRVAEAVAAYQALLNDPEAEEVVLVEANVARSARDLALSRLADVLAERGRALYDPFDATAREAWTAVAPVEAAPAAADDATVARWAEIARWYPFADVAPLAALRAAEQLARRDRPRDAAGLILDTLPAVENAEDRARLLARLATIADGRDWPDVARDAVADAAAINPTFPVGLGAVTQSARAWLSDDTFAPDRGALPRLGDVPTAPVAWVAPGSVVSAAEGAGRLDADTLLTFDGRTLRRFTPGAAEARWETDLPGDRAVLLGTGDPWLIWVARDEAVPAASLVGVDPRTGEILFGVSDAGELAGAERPDPAETPSAAILPSGEPFVPWGATAVATRDGAFLVARRGGMAAVEARAAEGATSRPAPPALRWRRDHPLRPALWSATDEVAWAVCGERGRDVESDANDAPPEDLGLPVCLIIDPASGETLSTVRTLEDREVKWTRVVEPRWLVLGTSLGIEAIDLVRGRRTRANLAPAAADAVGAWSIGDALLFQTASGRLHRFAPETGEIEPVAIPPSISGEDSSSEVLDVVAFGPERWIVHFVDRVVVIDDAGNALGRDAVVTDRRYTHVLAAEDRFFAISRERRPPSEPLVGEDRPTVFLDRVYVFDATGRLIDEAALPATGLPVDAARLADGWLLVGSGRQTVGVPAPAGR